MGAYKVLRQMLASVHRNRKLPVLIHDITGGDVQETMLCNGLPVLPGGVPPPGVGRVALYNGTLELLHQPPDQGRLQEVVAARLTG